MKVSELIEMLTKYKDMDGDISVRLDNQDFVAKFGVDYKLHVFGVGTNMKDATSTEVPAIILTLSNYPGE